MTEGRRKQDRTAGNGREADCRRRLRAKREKLLLQGREPQTELLGFLNKSTPKQNSLPRSK